MRALAARSGGAAGVSHDSPRAQTCTFQGSGLQNTTKIQREDTQRETETAKRWREREEKERNFGRSGGGGSSGGGVRRKGVQGSPNQQQPQQPQPQQRQTQNKWGPARSPKQGLGSLGVGHNNTQQHTTQQNNTTTQNNNTTTTQNNNTVVWLMGCSVVLRIFTSLLERNVGTRNVGDPQPLVT